MAASLNEIYKMLGELTGTVKAINEKVDDLKSDMGESEAASATSRANVHRRLDEVVLRTTHLETDMLTVKNKVEGVEAVTVDVISLRQQALGAGTLGHWLIKIGIAVVGFAGWAIGIYTWITGRPPP
ncbi:DUF1515 family protein [Allomesorhizobium alhagi]|uniref:DUF1515 domain-containing protein n=1 Tax=Mesorhizobium alhagi CCNWXJ12-2 TaxID=1107882 RepID=H0HQS2_9HYPH|nr:DUF1515 family protein [Mesorhizobium alhagi]EHK56886.1 hypothetical protein MAXJ12_12512 [Mesorhizobium alhagi CCNWXJ12-2]